MAVLDKAGRWVAQDWGKRKIDRYMSNPIYNRDFKRYKEQLETFLENPDLASLMVKKPSLPGMSNFHAKVLMIPEVAQRLGIDLNAPRYNTLATERLIDLLNVGTEIDAWLGKPDLRAEMITLRVGQLATNDIIYEGTDKVVMAGNAPSTVRFFVDVKREGETLYQVDIAGRPEHMPDEVPRSIYSFEVDRLGPPTLPPAEFDEVSRILGVLSTNQTSSKSQA